MDDINTIKNEISICLAENKQVWEHYGPLSEVARRNPHSDELYAIWTTERLSTIIPNNRKIVNILSDYRHLFDKGDQAFISKFLSHTESYERWVKDEIPYQAVMRFPVEFEKMILESK